MSTVYIVQDSFGKNLAPAREYGDMLIILDRNDAQHTIDFLVEKLRKKLSAITPQDYLLLIGDPIAIGIATSIALHNNCGILQVLRWDREHYKYDVKEIRI